MLIRSMVLATLLVAGSGLLRWVSAGEQLTTEGRLPQLSYAFERWNGDEAPPFDEEIVRVLGVDEYVHRVYRRDGSPVWLYVGYYGRQQEDETIHSPLNCLPGAGWEPVESVRVALPALDQSGAPTKIDVSQLIVENGARRQVVIYWYQSHGRVTGSEYSSKFFTALDSIRLNRSDGAIIRVIAPVDRDAATAVALARQFASDLFPNLSGVLPL